MASIVIRKASPQEATAISQLAIRSKAHWGYSAEEMKVFAQELTIPVDEIEPRHTHVSEDGTDLLGFYTLVVRPDGAVELEHLFIEPTRLRLGLGSQLFGHAKEFAKNLGYTRMLIQSDPNAQGFYAAHNATLVEYISSSIPGRSIPFFEVDLKDAVVS